MPDEIRRPVDVKRSLTILSAVNCGIWAISIIALVIVLQKGSGARGMFPILAGGVAVSIQLLAMARRMK